jgi:hypothetical protein
MNLPEPPRLPRLSELSDTMLQQLGITRAHAVTMDGITAAMMSTVMTLYGSALTVLADSVERFLTTVQDAHGHLLATVGVLREKAILQPEDAQRLRELVAEMRAGRAVDTVFEPTIGHEIRAALNELKDWIRRFEEKNRG